MQEVKWEIHFNWWSIMQQLSFQQWRQGWKVVKGILPSRQYQQLAIEFASGVI